MMFHNSSLDDYGDALQARVTFDTICIIYFTTLNVGHNIGLS